MFSLRIDAQRANSHPSPDPWEATGGGRGRVNPLPLTRISEILERRRNIKEEYEVVPQPASKPSDALKGLMGLTFILDFHLFSKLKSQMEKV